MTQLIAGLLTRDTKGCYTVKKVLLITCMVLLAGCGETENPKSVTTVSPAETDAPTHNERAIDAPVDWGVQVVSVRNSAAGYMLDFRYRVLDKDKALPILSRGVIPYLVDQKSGVKLMVPSSPKIGPLRQTALEAKQGKVYFILFANPGKMVSPGDRVTVVIGDFQAKDLVVQ